MANASTRVVESALSLGAKIPGFRRIADAMIEPLRFLEVEVVLEATRTSATEIISPRLSALTMTRTCGPRIF